VERALCVIKVCRVLHVMWRVANVRAKQAGQMFGEKAGRDPSGAYGSLRGRNASEASKSTARDVGSSPHQSNCPWFYRNFSAS
jgi:hypothetical protein